MRIKVNITTPGGYDSKNLFAGGSQHVVEIVQKETSGNWIVLTTTVEQGDADNPDHSLGREYACFYRPSGELGVGRTGGSKDLAGEIDVWSVEDVWDSSRATLGTVTFADDGGHG